MASTYPLEVVAAARWREQHPELKDKALEDALQSQSWEARGTVHRCARIRTAEGRAGRAPPRCAAATVAAVAATVAGAVVTAVEGAAAAAEGGAAVGAEARRAVVVGHALD